MRFFICCTNLKCFRCADSESMLSCVKPKVLAYITDAMKQDKLAITEDLALVKSRDVPEHKAEDHSPLQFDAADPSKRKLLRTLMLEKLDAYLSSHQLEAKLPAVIVGSNIVPRSLIDSMPKSLTIPLSDSSNEQGNLITNNTDIHIILFYNLHLYKLITKKKYNLRFLEEMF